MTTSSADMDMEANEGFIKITELDERVFNVIEQPLIDLIHRSRQGKQGKTLVLCAQFIGTTNFLKEGILDLAATDNPLAVRVLFRSLTEYYLRFTYIFMRALKEGDDAVANDYMHVLDAREMVDYAKALIFSGGLEKGKAEGKNAWSILEDETMNRNKVSKHEADRVTRLFQIKEIITFITNALATSSKGVPPLLQSLIPEYSLLSSNVHGGPRSFREMIEETNVERRHAAVLHYCELAFLMASSVKEFTFMLAAKHKPDLMHIAQRIASIRSELKSEIG